MAHEDPKPRGTTASDDAILRLYGNGEFDHWAHRSGLLTEEAFMIDRFLDPAKATLEGGCGGGAILLALRERGFGQLSGFDLVPAMINKARQRDGLGPVDLRILNAAHLDYPDTSFDQALYLQQLLSLVDDGARQPALAELHRVLRPGGVALLSLLCQEERMKSRVGRLFGFYLRVLRAVTFRRRSAQSWPYLKVGGRVNPRAFLDLGAQSYWFRIPEVHDFLAAAGFEVLGVGVDHELTRGVIHPSCAALATHGATGTIYVACRRVGV